MTPFEFLLQRRSTPSKLLAAPGPSPEQMTALLDLALRVPDHGALTPWRLIRIVGDNRARLGQRLAERSVALNPAAEPAAIEKDRQRFSHAPLILAVIARIERPHKIPEQEQLLSAGCLCMNLLLGAQALGFGAQWLTGWAAYDAEVARWFALSANERIVGFVHIGTPTAVVGERARPAASALLSDLTL